MTRAMRSFAIWASSRPYRLVLSTIVWFHLLAPVAAALLVVGALRRGPMAALQAALLAVPVVAVIALVVGMNLVETMSQALPILLGGAGSGALLGWSRSLSLAFQGTIAGSVIATVIVLALFVDPAQVGAAIQQFVLTMYGLMGIPPELTAQVAALDPNLFVWVLPAFLLLMILTGLILGHWWYALIDERANFGAEFRELKLGRVIGIILMVLILAGQFTDAVLIQSVAPMAVIGFLFQGLAVLHARRYSQNWPRAVLVIVYLLFVPLTYEMLMGLSAIGLIDNFFHLRARRKPEE